jgi:hypothetical protein
MFEFLKSEGFNSLGSLILGIGLMVLFKPMCKGEDCIIQKAPPVDEVVKSTYQIGSKCYQFKTQQIVCPERGAIEPFTIMSNSVDAQ